MCQYNTNDQSMYVLKGSKETLTALTVLIVTHVTQVKMLLNLLLMLKGSKVSNTLYTGPLAPAMREGYLTLPSWGFSCSPPVSLRRQLC